MSVQTEISRLESAKEAIATAIAGKGVTVPDGTMLDGMAALIEGIEAGGGDNPPCEYGTFTISSTVEGANVEVATVDGLTFAPKTVIVLPTPSVLMDGGSTSITTGKVSSTSKKRFAFCAIIDGVGHFNAALQFVNSNNGGDLAIYYNGYSTSKLTLNSDGFTLSTGSNELSYVGRAYTYRWVAIG